MRMYQLHLVHSQLSLEIFVTWHVPLMDYGVDIDLGIADTKSELGIHDVAYHT